MTESPKRLGRSNLLLSAMSRENRLLLLSKGERVPLSPGEVLFERGQEPVFVLFPSSGAVALTVPCDAASASSVLLVGREGMLGTHEVLDDSQTALRAIVQLPGQAYRITAVDFRRALVTSPDLRNYLLGYVGGVLNQIAIAALRNRFCAIAPRLAGWLLIFRDRADSDSFRLTQTSLALVLGVRREAVSTAAGQLQQQNLIAYRRGELTVLNAAGLLQVAGQVDRLD